MSAMIQPEYRGPSKNVRRSEEGNPNQYIIHSNPALKLPTRFYTDRILIL